jgi:hypothetical protein
MTQEEAALHARAARAALAAAAIYYTHWMYMYLHFAMF